VQPNEIGGTDTGEVARLDLLGRVVLLVGGDYEAVFFAYEVEILRRKDLASCVSEQPPIFSQRG
jgi:hypothetical protein